MNQIFLIGRITKKPEQQQTPGGVAFCRFALAVDRKYKNANGEKETDFLNVVAWRQTAELCCKYLDTGRQVCVVGSVQNRSYEDKEGVKRYVTEVIAEQVEFIGSQQKADTGETTPSKAVERPKQVSALEPIDDDFLPF